MQLLRYASMFNDYGGHEFLGNSGIEFAVGARYVSISQSNTASAQANIGGLLGTSTGSTTQDFSGLGLTANLIVDLPTGTDVWGRVEGRGSILLGENHRQGSTSFSFNGASTQSETLSESKSQIVPALEVKAGISWVPGQATEYGATQKAMGLRAFLVGQYWGGVGPLRNGNALAFRSSDLYLAGFSVEFIYSY